MNTATHALRHPPHPWIGAILTCSILIAAAALPAGSAAAADQLPTAPVETLHHTLIETMKAASQPDGTPPRALAAVVPEVFAVARLARIVLGAHWDSLDAERRNHMIDVFTRYTTANYVARFKKYSGERFETLDTRPLKRGRAAVRTLLHLPGGGIVQLDYVVQPTDAGWQIVNVLANGVSELALRRAEYDGIMNTDGFEALIERIERQVAQLTADSP